MKIGLDFHGVIDREPEMFSFINPEIWNKSKSIYYKQIL